MKKLFLVALLVVGLTTFAQGRIGHVQEGEKVTPEKRAEKQVERMTKELSLNETQVKQLNELFAKGLAEREGKRAEMQKRRAEGAKPTPEERETMKAKMGEKQEAMRAEMKKILTQDQYTKWEENKEERKEKVAQKMEERKENRKK
jgi:periplasmic protein CpxP/Spy